MSETRYLRIKYDTLENIIASNLYALGIVNDADEIESIDFGLEVDEEGFVELDVTIAAKQLSLKL